MNADERATGVGRGITIRIMITIRNFWEAGMVQMSVPQGEGSTRGKLLIYTNEH